MNHVYETAKPSTRAALQQMGDVCCAIWADHRASARAYRAQRATAPAPAAERNDVLHLLLKVLALVAVAALLGMALSVLVTDFLVWLRLDLFSAAGAAALLVPAQEPSRMEALRLLAARSGGVSNYEVQQQFGITSTDAGRLLHKAVQRIGAIKQQMDGERARWFMNASDCKAWADANVDLKKPSKKARVISVKTRREGTASWANQPGVMTAATRIVRIPTCCTAAVPTVPGWGRPPPIRDGAMDFKQHMHHAQAFAHVNGGQHE